MKLRALCRRTTLELVRDPLTLGFGLGFPLVLLLLLSAIQANIPVSLFEIDPGHHRVRSGVCGPVLRHSGVP